MPIFTSNLVCGMRFDKMCARYQFRNFWRNPGMIVRRPAKVE